jgi:tellurite resistance protein
MDAALGAALRGPDMEGGWQHGRVILQDADSHSRLCIPPFEVFGALTDIGGRCLMDKVAPAAKTQEVISALARGLDLADQTELANEHEGEMLRGWSDDDDPLVDASTLKSWATAAVLGFAVETQRIRHRLARRATLQELNATQPWEPNWPSWLEWDSYKEENEPEEMYPILEFIHEKVVEPREEDPGKSRSEPVVLLLFGPPGTTKTTIARAVAQGLSWPLVTLSPGNFIEQGLEKVEVQSKTVFDQLAKLSQAVVVLDECDELFRARKPTADDDNSDLMRTGAAFMTASMLPKLQDLHDRGRVVVFICTNFLDQMDSAMRRIGRIDHIIAVPPPDEAQRNHMVRTELKSRDLAYAKKQYIEEALKTLVAETRRFIRGEVIAAARELYRQKRFTEAAKAEQAALEIAHRMRDSTSIAVNGKLYEQFLKDKKELSEPHRKPRDGKHHPDTQ